MSDFETDDFHDESSLLPQTQSEKSKSNLVERAPSSSIQLNSIFVVERAWGRAIVISKPSGVENNNKQQAAERDLECADFPVCYQKTAVRFELSGARLPQNRPLFLGNKRGCVCS